MSLLVSLLSQIVTLFHKQNKLPIHAFDEGETRLQSRVRADIEKDQPQRYTHI